MIVGEFVQNKINELKLNGYKNVEFASASDCTLVRNGIVESFLIAKTNMDHSCKEAALDKIERDIEVQGSKIRIFAIPKGKRKPTTLTYYTELFKGE